MMVAAVVVVTGLAVVAIALLVAGGSDDAPDTPVRAARSQLTLERFVLPTTGQPELLISLPDQRLNTLETTGGATSVLLRCVDGAGAVKIRQQTEWPLLEEEGYPLPHIHQPLQPDVLNAVRSCRLTGTGIDFAGRTPGRVPAAQ